MEANQTRKETITPANSSGERIAGKCERAFQENESADAEAIRGVDELSSVSTPRVKPGLARPSGQCRRKLQVRLKFASGVVNPLTNNLLARLASSTIRMEPHDKYGTSPTCLLERRSTIRTEDRESSRVRPLLGRQERNALASAHQTTVTNAMFDESKIESLRLR